MRRKRRLIWTSLSAAAIAAPAALPAATAAPAQGLPFAARPSSHAHVGSLPAGGSGRAVKLWQIAAGGEGGEGGEGGIDPARAKDDPVAYLVALDVMAAHYHAGRAAYAAGHADDAAELFAHAISEVHAELEPALKALGVIDFKPLMEKTVEQASAKAPADQVTASADAVLAALKTAASHAPRSAAPPLVVERQVLANMLDRAALQYSSAMRAAEGDAYLDGYGFYSAAKVRAAAIMPQLAKTSPEMADKASEALALMDKAYASIERPAAPAVEPGELFVVVSRAVLAMGSS